MNNLFHDTMYRAPRFGPMWVPQRKRRRKMQRQYRNYWRKAILILMEAGQCKDTGIGFIKTEFLMPDFSKQLVCETIYGVSINPHGVGVIIQSD